MSNKIRIVRGPRGGRASIDETLAFAASLPPALEPGPYSLTATHDVQSTDQTTVDGSFAATASLIVYGSRYSFAGDAIVSQSPAPGTSGSLDGLLASVVINLPTLPWTYAPGEAADPPGAARLGILVIADEDVGAPLQTQPMTWSDVLATASPVYFPGLTAELGEDASASVTVIDIPYALFGDIAPLKSDLPYLAQVRLAQLDAETLQYQAVVVGTRIVYGSGSYTAYLVSLDGYADALPTNDDGSLPDGDNYQSYRLVVLTQWRFTNTASPYSFANLVQNLNGTFSADPVLAWVPPAAKTVSPSPIPYEGVADLLSLGYVPLPHLLRQGSATVSFYRGPLAPIPLGLDPAITALMQESQPITDADQVLSFDPATGTFDARLAAAWQLGQGLAATNGRLLAAMQTLGLAAAQQQIVAAGRAGIARGLGSELGGARTGELLRSLGRHLLDRTTQALAIEPSPSNQEISS